MFLMDENSSAGEFGTNAKYKDLEINYMWHLKWKLILFIVGALGTVKKDTKQYLEQIPDFPV